MIIVGALNHTIIDPLLSLKTWLEHEEIDAIEFSEELTFSRMNVLIILDDSS